MLERLRQRWDHLQIIPLSDPSCFLSECWWNLLKFAHGILSQLGSTWWWNESIDNTQNHTCRGSSCGYQLITSGQCHSKGTDCDKDLMKFLYAIIIFAYVMCKKASMLSSVTKETWLLASNCGFISIKLPQREALMCIHFKSMLLFEETLQKNSLWLRNSVQR